MISTFVCENLTRDIFLEQLYYILIEIIPNFYSYLRFFGVVLSRICTLNNQEKISQDKIAVELYLQKEINHKILKKEEKTYVEVCCTFKTF